MLYKLNRRRKRIGERENNSAQGVSFIDSVRALEPINVCLLPMLGALAVRAPTLISTWPILCRGVVGIEPFAKANLVSNLLLLNNGQEYDFDASTKVPNEPYVYYSDSDRDSYIEEKSMNALYDHERFSFQAGVSLPRLVGVRALKTVGCTKQTRLLEILILLRHDRH